MCNTVRIQLVQWLSLVLLNILCPGKKYVTYNISEVFSASKSFNSKIKSEEMVSPHLLNLTEPLLKVVK